MKEEVYTEETMLRPAPAAMRRVSWGAIFAGLFVTLMIQVTLTLLGAGIGLAAINPTTQQNPGKELAIGSAIWLVVTGLISLFIGAYVSGRMSGGPRRADGLLHGIVTWSVTEVVTIILLMTAVGALIGGIANLLGGAIGIAHNTAGGESNVASAQDELKELFTQPGNQIQPTGRTPTGQGGPSELTTLAQQDPQLGAVLAKLEAKGGPTKDTADRDQLINLLTSKHNMDQQQASNLVNQWDEQFQQIKGQTAQQPRQVGEQAASGISKTSLAGFVAMLLGLLVAAWGGWAGAASLTQYRAVTTVNAPATPARAA